MKKIILSLSFAISLAFAACESKSTSIAISDTPSELKLTAQYALHQTDAAQKYMETYLQEDRIFQSVQEEKNAEIRLADGTTFQISYQPGSTKIKFNKKGNSFSSYQRIKKMMTGFANAIKD